MLELTIRAFNLAERYRTPVILLADETVGHLSEKVDVPSRESIEIWERPRARNLREYRRRSTAKIPPMACAGEGYWVHVTGLTHDPSGNPDITAEAQERLVRRLVAKIRENAKAICDLRYEWFGEEVVEYVVVAYGISARCARAGVKKAREHGIKACLLRLVTLWPFPETVFRELAGDVDAFVVAELNCGQIFYEVQRCVGAAKVVPLLHPGGKLLDPEAIYKTLKKIVAR
jgi:2-oxoglutarate ferredoxin oxidoreductase subunit alpha